MAWKRLRGPGLAPSALSSARWAATSPDGAGTIAHVCICGPAPLSPPPPAAPRRKEASVSVGRTSLWSGLPSTLPGTLATAHPKAKPGGYSGSL